MAKLYIFIHFLNNIERNKKINETEIIPKSHNMFDFGSTNGSEMDMEFQIEIGWGICGLL